MTYKWNLFTQKKNIFSADFSKILLSRTQLKSINRKNVKNDPQ